MIKTYTLLTKPGIIMGNAITTTAGFVLASKGHFDVWLFLTTLIGLGSVIASACVFNNTIDRFSDAKMERTKNRALAKGLISPKHAIVFATLLSLFGLLILGLFTNTLAVFIALIGFLVYVALYSICKYHSVYGTIVGSIAGATPPVVGYCAASNTFDAGALILFLILVLWQMPHFYSITMYRYDDYVAAAIPVLPVKKGVHTTKIHMILYIAAFTIASLSLTAFGYTGYAYLSIASVLGLTWLALCVKGFLSDNDKLWGRQMFVLSLVIVTTLCITMSVDVV